MLFCADLHVGNHRRAGGPIVGGMNTRCRETIEVLDRAVDLAIQKSEPLIVAGDIFDSSKPNPQQVAAVQRSLVKARQAKVLIILLAGNHDQYSDGQFDNALAPLQHHAMVVSTPTVHTVRDTDLVLLPARSGAAVEWLLPTLEELLGQRRATRPRILVLHCGIETKETPPWLKGAHDSVPVSLLLNHAMLRHSIEQTFAGNWHEYGRWHQRGASVTQCGALCPTGWDNSGLDPYGRVCRDDGTSITIPGPRFVSIWREQVNAAMADMLQAMRHDQHHVYVRAVVPIAQMATAAKRAAELSDDRFTVVVEPSTDEMEVAARQATEAVKSTVRFDDALARFVAFMPLKDGVDRQNVLELSKRYVSAQPS